MARMIPELDEFALSQVRSNAERLIYRSFRDSVDKDVLVVHSLELIAYPPSKAPTDAEADFVVFDPHRGFIVIEVKGGGVTYDAGEGCWWSKDRKGVQHQIKDPFRQAKSAKHEILRTLKTSKNWGAGGMPRIIAGHAVIFPDLFNVGKLSAPDKPIEIIGNHKVVDDASDWLNNVFDFWGKNNRDCHPIGKRGMDVIESLFCRNFAVDVPLALDIEREHRRQIELTERQGRILRSLRYRKRAAISGGAGTGKTLLALQQAKNLASQGVKTLLVCFNRALADFLKREAEGIDNLHTLSFHQLCDWRIQVCGKDLLQEAQMAYLGRSLFDVQMPYALARSTELNNFRYQAIVVDEGQDFGDEYWLPIELLLEDEQESFLYIFFDPNQIVYRNASTFPINDPPFLLTENCRNTRNIHNIAYQYYVGDEVDPPDIEGEPPEILEASNLYKQARKIKEKVSELIIREHLSPHDIVVLVVAENKGIYYEALQKLGCSQGIEWSFELLWKPATVLVDTAKRFKGLEGGVVLLWGFDELNAKESKELLYVALSRARFRLFLVGVESDIMPLICQTAS